MENLDLTSGEEKKLIKLYKNYPTSLPAGKEAVNLMLNGLICKEITSEEPVCHNLTTKGLSYAKKALRKEKEVEHKEKISTHNCVSQNTPLKHQYWRMLVDLHITMCKKKILTDPSIMTTFLYWDLNGGPGIYPPGSIEGINHEEVCSSVDFIRIARDRNLASDITICESEPHIYKQCQKTVQEEQWGPSVVTVRRGSNYEIAKETEELSKSYMGLAYADPYGAGREEWKALRYLAETRPYMDLMMHVQGGTMKRHNRNPKTGPAKGYLSLHDQIKSLRDRGKQKMLIRFLKNSQMQTAFLFATHHIENPELYEQLGFHDIDGEYGKYILQNMDNTEDETGHSTRVE